MSLRRRRLLVDQLATQCDELLIRSGSVVSRVVGGETLVVPVRGKVGDLASIYSFNGTGSFIWKLLESPMSHAELVHDLEDEYEVGHEQAGRDVASFVEELLLAELVEVQGAAVGAQESGKHFAGQSTQLLGHKPASRL